MLNSFSTDMPDAIDDSEDILQETEESETDDISEMDEEDD
jgi:hypothetical protein